MYLDHLGYVTNNLDLFEKFWVDILGFKMIFQSRILPKMNEELFGIKSGAFCARYQKGKMVIEVHVYDKRVKKEPQPFNQFGLNHIGLFVKSRKDFLKKYDFEKRIYNNPKGWQNIFIKDFEGNWVELKEKL